MIFKKILRFFIILFLVLISISCAVFFDEIPQISVNSSDQEDIIQIDTNTNAKWLPLGVSNFTMGASPALSMALNTNDYPCIVFSDFDNNSGKVKAMSWDGANWNNVGALISTSSARETAFTFDSDGIMYTAYTELSKSYNISVKIYTNFTWYSIGIEGFASGPVTNISIAINHSNQLFASFIDISNGNKLVVMRFYTNAWSILGGSAVSSGAAGWPSLVFDSSNVLYIAYQDSTSGNKITVKYFDGSSWKIVGKAGISDGAASFISITVDHENNPFVGYKDLANGQRATVMTYDKNKWKLSKKAGFTSSTADFVDITSDSNGNIYLLYADGGKGGKSTVLKYDRSVWRQVGNSGFSYGEIANATILINQSDNPIVSFMDLSGNKAAFLYKYQP